MLLITSIVEHFPDNSGCSHPEAKGRHDHCKSCLTVGDIPLQPPELQPDAPSCQSLWNSVYIESARWATYPESQRDCPPSQAFASARVVLVWVRLGREIAKNHQPLTSLFINCRMQSNGQWQCQNMKANLLGHAEAEKKLEWRCFQAWNNEGLMWVINVSVDRPALYWDMAEIDSWLTWYELLVWL